MAPQNDADDLKKKRREREREREEEDRREKEAQHTSKAGSGKSPGPATSKDTLNELLAKTEPLMDQVDHLYQLYMTGHEKRPPLELRGRLENLIIKIQQIQMSSLGAPLNLFKANTIVSRYNILKDRWEKLLRDLESGKIKRAQK